MRQPNLKPLLNGKEENNRERRFGLDGLQRLIELGLGLSRTIGGLPGI